MSRGMYPRRIKLKPMDPEILARYLSNWPGRDLYHHPEKFPPLTAKTFFGEAVPLHLEIGCGTGEFLCTLATRSPKVGYFGVDIAYKPLTRAIELASSLELENIHFFKADIRLLAPLIPSQSIDLIYLHFPAPARKKASRRYRLFDQEFLDQVFRMLVPGGRMSVMTDNEVLFDEMLSLSQKDTRFSFIPEEAFTIRFDEELKSHNQRLWESRGHRLQRFEIRSALSNP